MAMKKKLANWLLKKKTAKVVRKVRVHNFASAKSIGVLWSLEEKKAYKIIQKFCKEHNISMKSLHYSSELDAEMVQENSFGKEQLNWLGFPKEGFVNEFINKEFDILLDLSIHKRFPLRVVSNLSDRKSHV